MQIKKPLFLFAIIVVVALLISACSDNAPPGPEAMPITCVNNLRQIGLSYRIWAGGHGELYPHHVSTNDGGSLELCGRDAEGFDTNAFHHLMTMTEELTHPGLLTCPNDPARIPVKVKDFTFLTPGHISYRFRTGSDVRESVGTNILAVCPIDGNKLLCDGSVESPPPPKTPWYQFWK